MTTEKTIINIILDRLRRNKLLSDISFETVVDYTIDFMQVVGFPTFYEEKSSIIAIEDYRGVLPAGCVDIIGVRLASVDSAGNAKGGVGVTPSFRKATDIFFTSSFKTKQVGLVYNVKGNVIYTSLEDGYIEVVYSAVQTDRNGFPMIPDNRNFMIALEDYIKCKHFEMLFEQGKLDAKILDHAEKEYYWAVGRCESEFHKLSFDEAESLGAQWRQVLISNKEHYNGYANIGVTKNLKIK